MLPDSAGLVPTGVGLNSVLQTIFEKQLERHLLDEKYPWRSFDARSEPANLINSKRNYNKPTCQGMAIRVGVARQPYSSPTSPTTLKNARPCWF